MEYTDRFRLLFTAITALVIGFVSLTRCGNIDMHAIFSMFTTLVPAIIIMGFLGQKMGEILDKPKNKADAEYKVAVLDALKQMDNSITLQELNEKLQKQVAEPDIHESDEDLDE